MQKSELRREVDAVLRWVLDPLQSLPHHVHKAVYQADPVDLFGQEVAGKIKTLEQQLPKIEKAMQELLEEQWEASLKEAHDEAAKLFEVDQFDQLAGGASTALTEELANKALTAIAQKLGPDFEKLTSKQVMELIASAYLKGREASSLMLHVTPQLNLADHRTLETLKGHHVFWIGQHYETSLQESLTWMVRDQLKQGLGRRDIGRMLRDTLGTLHPRSDRYWEGLAAVIVTRTRSMAAVGSFEQAGVATYEILAMMDERTCPVCQQINGTVFSIGDLKRWRDDFADAYDPADIKAAHPWLKLKEVEGLTADELAAKGQQAPPFHFHCRCGIIMKDFEPPTAEEPLDIQFTKVEPGPDLPSESQLKYVKNGSYLGGAGSKSIYKDAKGQEYIFKPAVTKSGYAAEYKAYVQELAAQLGEQLYAQGDTVPLRTVKLENKMGTLQPLLSGVTGDLKATSWKNLSPEQIRRIVEEHVLDWTLGNFDSHAGNFILLDNGRILGIDKEQCFRYLNDANSGSMSLTYHPNAHYGEEPPIYNQIFEAFAKGQIDLDLNSILPALQRLEAISDSEYRDMLRPYAEALHGAGSTEATSLISKAVARKNQVRAEYEKFFTSLLKSRVQTYHGTFKFLDTATAAQKAGMPLSAQMLSTTDLQHMSGQQLWKLAKASNVPYFNFMTHDELVAAITQPWDAVDIGNQARERARLKREAKARAKAQPAPGQTVADFSTAVGKTWLADRRDGANIENQHIQIRAVKEAATNKQGYQVSFKVTSRVHSTLTSELGKLQAFGDEYGIPLGRQLNGLFDIQDIDGPKKLAKGWTYIDPNSKLMMRFSDSKDYMATYGKVDVYVWEQDGQKAATMFNDFMKQFKALEGIDRKPGTEDEYTLRLARLAWQHAPQSADAAAKFKDSKRIVQELESGLLQAGIDPQQAWKLEEREVVEGYRTYVNPGIAKEYEAKGARYLLAGVRANSADRIVQIHNNGGLKSTVRRWSDGDGGHGASSSTDVETGGADSSFLRIVTRSAVGQKNFRDHYAAGNYQIIVDVKELERTDWYAYHGDKYGRTKGLDFDMRMAAKEHIEHLDNWYRSDNEIMMRQGVPVSSWTGITCQRLFDKETLTQAFRDAGITKINGIPIEKFIEVKEKV